MYSLNTQGRNKVFHFLETHHVQNVYMSYEATCTRVNKETWQLQEQETMQVCLIADFAVEEEEQSLELGKEDFDLICDEEKGMI